MTSQDHGPVAAKRRGKHAILGVLIAAVLVVTVFLSIALAQGNNPDVSAAPDGTTTDAAAVNTQEPTLGTTTPVAPPQVQEGSANANYPQDGAERFETERSRRLGDVVAGFCPSLVLGYAAEIRGSGPIVNVVFYTAPYEQIEKDPGTGQGSIYLYVFKDPREWPSLAELQAQDAAERPSYIPKSTTAEAAIPGAQLARVGQIEGDNGATVMVKLHDDWVINLISQPLGHQGSAPLDREQTIELASLLVKAMENEE